MHCALKMANKALLLFFLLLNMLLSHSNCLTHSVTDHQEEVDNASLSLMDEDEDESGECELRQSTLAHRSNRPIAARAPFEQFNH